MKKLERDALLADREAVKAVLSSISPEDPLGRMNFEDRLHEIDDQLSALEARNEPLGSVALMFSGMPVLGARAIDADFASSMLDTFQDLVTKRVASREFGPLGDRGRVPLRSSASLAITDIIRGSIGFVLEENATNAPLVDTAVKQAIDDVSAVIARAGALEEQEFESAVESLDHRLLVSLRSFFRTLDERQAMLRLVEGERDSFLDAVAVRRARDRVETTEIRERDTEVIGELLGLLPSSRQFEMRLESGETIKGRVASDTAEKYLELIESPRQKLVGRKWRTRMQIREVRERNKPPRSLYLLLGLLQPVST